MLALLLLAMAVYSEASWLTSLGLSFLILKARVIARHHRLAVRAKRVGRSSPVRALVPPPPPPPPPFPENLDYFVLLCF